MLDKDIKLIACSFKEYFEIYNICKNLSNLFVDYWYFLLDNVIGDTIRISLAADPVEEIKVGFDLLKSLHLRSKGINLVACPSCSRQNFDVIKTVNELERRVEDITTPLDVAVIGCIVNGPGEAKQTEIGITGGGKDNHMLYLNGLETEKVMTKDMVNKIVSLVEEKVSNL